MALTEPETGTDSGPRTGTRILSSKGTETGTGIGTGTWSEAQAPS